MFKVVLTFAEARPPHFNTDMLGEMFNLLSQIPHVDVNIVPGCMI